MAPLQFRGKERLANWMGGVARRFTPEADCHPVPRARVIVSLEERVGRLMWAGCYERELVALLAQVLDPDMTFVDIGAQIGYFSVVAAALVGKRGAVHSFEPDPDCFSRLVRNASAYPWVTAHNSAVADRDGEIPFYRTPKQDESGWGAIFNEDGERAQISARVCTLDKWTSAAEIGRIDFLKIDVEGAECRILDGAKAAIAKTRPMMWVEANEVCLSRDAKSVSLLVERLNAWNYVTQGVCERRSNSFENIVAIPRERRDLLERIARVNLRFRAVSAVELVGENHIVASPADPVTGS